MFNTQGWKDFQEDVKVELASSTNYSDLDCDTNDKWQYRRGQIAKLRALANYEVFIKTSYEEAINAELEEEDKD